MKRYLNIGCGSTYHKDWINIDIQSRDPNVDEVDIRKGLPYKDGSIFAIFCSHVLEHLTPDEAINLLHECFRVLSPGGVIRILVPDLERTVKEYMSVLKIAKKEKKYLYKYKWITVELLDQLVRTQSGGEMLKLFKSADYKQRAYIFERVGYEAKSFWDVKNKDTLGNSYLDEVTFRIKKFDFLWMIKTLRKYLSMIMVYVFGGKNLYRDLSTAIFRSAGEIHKYMYDELSLSLLLKQVRFKKISRKKFGKSLIPNYSKYGLEIINNSPRKPDSLIIEAIK